MDIEAQAKRMIEAVRGFVAKSEAALDKRLKEVEQRVASLSLAKGDKGDKGDKGADADPALMHRLIAEAVESVPRLKGEPGKDADPEQIRRLVEQAAAALPKPKDGKDGESIKGEKGEPGKDADAAQVLQLIDQAVARLPKPKDGEKGAPGPAVEEAHLLALVERAVGGLPKPKDGRDGAPGEAGKGEKGEKGDPGKDVEPEMVRLVAAEILPGMVERAQDVLAERLRAAVAALPAPAAGAAGKDGKDGASIHPDSVALMVNAAVGKAIAALPRPKDGVDGAAGRDAPELAVLARIDEARSYPAGTYAKHAGGEIRAERHTDPVKDGDLLAAGWSVARDGVAAIVVSQGEDPRQLEVATLLTSGAKAIAAFRLPAMIYQGVWREGEFSLGDVVTWGGSAWHSQIDKNNEKPGSSSGGWKLMVKEGAKGRDAEPAAPAQKGLVHLK